MTNKDSFDDRPEEFSNTNKSPDIWYKLRSAGGIATAVVVAFIGALGSYIMNNQQTLSTRAQLYTELMSQRENAESVARKDMFEKILTSFLTGEINSQCVLEQIDDELLRLELLARNFHEMIDMEPLFLHVLLKIVRKIPLLQDPSFNQNSKKEDKKEEASISSLKRDLLNRWEKTPGKLNWGEFKGEMMRKKLNQLFKIARRITKKQIESLSSVQIRQRLIIDLSKTCQDIRPTHFTNQACDREGYREEFLMKIKGIKKRDFTVMVTHSYPKWNQVRISVEVKKTKEEMLSDPKGKDFHEAKFWLSYFDFPLAENSFLSDKERYAVVLDEIDRGKMEAHISLLYFPASYAGLKEKSFYQQKLISTLLEGNSLN